MCSASAFPQRRDITVRERKNKLEEDEDRVFKPRSQVLDEGGVGSSVARPVQPLSRLALC